MAKILVVDDEADIREVVTIVLQSAGHDVMCAENGKKGLSLIKKIDPDLIVLDVMMPKMNGLEVLRLLRNMEAYDHIPVVMLTASTKGAKESDDYYQKKTGVEVFMSKPFEPAELVNKIAQLLKDHHRKKGDGLIRYKIS